MEDARDKNDGDETHSTSTRSKLPAKRKHSQVTYHMPHHGEYTTYHLPPPGDYQPVLHPLHSSDYAPATYGPQLGTYHNVGYPPHMVEGFYFPSNPLASHLKTSTPAGSECSSKSEDKKQLRWDTSMDNVLLDTLCEAVREGKKNGRKWDPSVMKNVVGELCKVTNDEVRVTHIENRLRQMRTEYVNYKDLKEKSGGSRDLINDAIDFPPEVWSEILANPKEKKKYGAFKERGPKWNFDKLALVMGNYHATGSYSFTGLDDNDEENVDLPSNKETIDLEESEESGSCARNTNPSQPKRQHGIRRQAFDEMKDMLGNVNSNLEKLRESVDPLHFGKLLRKAIDDVKDFSEKYLNVAFRILMKNRVDGEIFILSNEEGKKDILREMREQIGNL